MLKCSFILLFVFIIGFSPVIADDKDQKSETPNATELVKKADLLLRGENSSEHYVDFVVNRPGQKIARKVIVYLKSKKYSLTHFIKPIKDRDTTILKRDYDMWMYTPSVRKKIRIPFGMMHQGVLGSDFTYDDLLKESTLTDDYTHKIVSESKGMKKKHGKVYIVDLAPIAGRPVTYKKLRLWIREKGSILLRTQYYNEKLEVVRVLSYSDLKVIDGREIPTTWKMSNLEHEGYSTDYTIIDGKYNKIEDDNIFAPKTLENPPSSDWK